MRDRKWTAVLLGFILVIGLASRKYSGMFPAALGKYPGDALWAAAVYVALAIVFRKAEAMSLFAWAIAISFAVEFSQIYHSPTLDALRSTTIGHLFLGTTYSPHDLLAYVVGIVLISGFDYLAMRRKGVRWANL